jgi:hypothetical protein
MNGDRSGAVHVAALLWLCACNPQVEIAPTDGGPPAPIGERCPAPLGPECAATDDPACALLTACAVGTCDGAGTCGHVFAAAAAPCAENGGSQCDGAGSCVCVGEGCATPGRVLWARELPPVSSADLRMDGHGNIVLTGTFVANDLTGSTLDFGNGPIVVDPGTVEIYLAKLDPEGHAIWSKRFPGTAPSGSLLTAYLAVHPSGKIALVGELVGSIDFGDGPLTAEEGARSSFVATFDGDGVVQWSRRLTQKSCCGMTNVVFGPGGELFFFGDFDDEHDFAPGTVKTGGRDLFLLKLDADGHTLWVRQADQPSAVPRLYANGLTGDAHGNVYLTGLTLQEQTALFGCTKQIHANSGFLVALDPDGSARWVAGTGAPAIGAAVDARGQVVVGDERLEVVGFNARGAQVWDHPPASIYGLDGFYSLVSTSWGGTVLMGSFSEGQDLVIDGTPIDSGGGAGSLFASLDGFGHLRALEAFTVPSTFGYAASGAVAVDPSTGLAVTVGSFDGKLSIGGFTLDHDGYGGHYLAKIRP